MTFYKGMLVFLCFKRQVKSRTERVLSTFRYIPTSTFTDGKQAFGFKALMNDRVEIYVA